jgi:ATP-dependent Clp protease ATP-binding subunit ClpA
MYPFERFTERAKKALTLAQKEAERSRHSYIGTEHLLIGLMRERDGLGAIVLDDLGVELSTVRKTVASVLGGNERIIIQQIIPTSRVKKVIQISFEEARRMGDAYVGTEHLLLGLLIEGEGVAAHVLEDLGVDIDAARAQIASVRHASGAEEAGAQAAFVPHRRSDFGLAFNASALAAIARAGVVADRKQRQAAGTLDLLIALVAVGTEHFLAALLSAGTGEATRVLRDAGVTAAKVLAELERLIP